MITCNHILNENHIKKGEKIQISFNNENEFIITIDGSTTTYTNEEYDITIIEIKGNKYNEISFLEIDNNINNTINLINIYKKKDIYLPHYQEGKDIKCSDGKLIDLYIDNITIKHNCTTEEGSSGSPIINKDSDEVIGIHIGDIPSEKLNKGIIIKKPIDDFIEKYKKSFLHDEKSNITKICRNRVLYIIIAIIILIIILIIGIIVLILIIKNKNSDDDKHNPLLLENSITILYKKQIDEFGNIRIFGDDFVESNLLSYNIYYDKKKYNLKNYFNINDMNKNDEILKIYLTGINNIEDIKGMFKGCTALISLPDI